MSFGNKTFKTFLNTSILLLLTSNLAIAGKVEDAKKRVEQAQRDLDNLAAKEIQGFYRAYKARTSKSDASGTFDPTCDTANSTPPANPLNWVGFSGQGGIFSKHIFRELADATLHKLSQSDEKWLREIGNYKLIQLRDEPSKRWDALTFLKNMETNSKFNQDAAVAFSKLLLDGMDANKVAKTDEEKSQSEETIDIALAGLERFPNKSLPIQTALAKILTDYSSFSSAAGRALRVAEVVDPKLQKMIFDYAKAPPANEGLFPLDPYGNLITGRTAGFQALYGMKLKDPHMYLELVDLAGDPEVKFEDLMESVGNYIPESEEAHKGVLERATKAPFTDARIAAAAACSAIPKSSPVFANVRKSINTLEQSTNREDRIIALVMIRYINRKEEDPQLTQLAIRALEDESPRIQKRGILALTDSSLKNPETQLTIVKVLHSGDPIVAETAKNAIISSDPTDPRVQKALIDLLSGTSNNSKARYHAAEALGQINPTTPAIVAALESMKGTEGYWSVEIGGDIHTSDEIYFDGHYYRHFLVKDSVKGALAEIAKRAESNRPQVEAPMYPGAMVQINE